MLNLTTELKPMLYKVEFTPCLDLELDNVNWESAQSEEFAQSGFQHRLSCIDLADCPNLQNLVDQVRSEQYGLLSRLWDDRHFREHLWNGYTFDQFAQQLEPYFELCKDMPGYHCDIHVDHRRAVTSGMIFFNELDIPEQNTVFYDNYAGHRPLRIASNMGHGWFSANTHMSWHSGANKGKTVRYSMKFGLHFKLH